MHGEAFTLFSVSHCHLSPAGFRQWRSPTCAARDHNDAAKATVVMRSKWTDESMHEMSRQCITVAHKHVSKHVTCIHSRHFGQKALLMRMHARKFRSQNNVVRHVQWRPLIRISQNFIRLLDGRNHRVIVRVCEPRKRTPVAKINMLKLSPPLHGYASAKDRATLPCCCGYSNATLVSSKLIHAILRPGGHRLRMNLCHCS